MTTPSAYYSSADDGEGTSAHPVPGEPGVTLGADYLSAWQTIGYTAQLGANGEFNYSALIPGTARQNSFAQLPTGLSQPTKVTQRYLSPDGDPLGGFLTFMPSSAITVTDSGVTYRIPRRLSGTETWPSLDSGVSPWAFSMEGSGSIYIWLGLMTVVLLPCDSSSIITDDGSPLTYHVVEHFIGGRQFDISVPTSNDTQDLYSLMIPGTICPAEFDPVNPLGSLLGKELSVQPFESAEFDRCQSQLSIEYDIVNLSDLPALSEFTINPGSDTIRFAYIQGPPTSGTTWVSGAFVSGGPPYEAQVLTGPTTSAALTPGKYDRWITIASSPQSIVARAGTLTIY